MKLKVKYLTILEKLYQISEPQRGSIYKTRLGERIALIDFATIFVITTDPITGADDEVGILGIHIACNDLASSGAEPVGILVTILAPAGTELDTIEKLLNQIKEVSAAMKIDVIGGHTEVTDAVNRMVLSITAIGKAKNDKLINTKGAKPGDSIIFTKYAATEGTAILSGFSKKSLIKNLVRSL